VAIGSGGYRHPKTPILFLLPFFNTSIVFPLGIKTSKMLPKTPTMIVSAYPRTYSTQKENLCN